MSIKRADWVVCTSDPTHYGTVKRMAKDGSWADVSWGLWTKRMQTGVLTPVFTVDIGGGWEVTDLTRKAEQEEVAATTDHPQNCQCPACEAWWSNYFADDPDLDVADAPTPEQEASE